MHKVVSGREALKIKPKCQKESTKQPLPRTYRFLGIAFLSRLRALPALQLDVSLQHLRLFRQHRQTWESIHGTHQNRNKASTFSSREHSMAGAAGWQWDHRQYFMSVSFKPKVGVGSEQRTRHTRKSHDIAWEVTQARTRYGIVWSTKLVLLLHMRQESHFQMTAA